MDSSGSMLEVVVVGKKLNVETVKGFVGSVINSQECSVSVGLRFHADCIEFSDSLILQCSL